MANDGLSQSRLERLREIMHGHVVARRLPGALWLVARRGEVRVDHVGTFALDGDQGSEQAMERDTLFRIASMTKPIAALATAMLLEECRLRLDEPVTRWLPELGDRRVLRDVNGPLSETVPARRDISVRDLLTNRMGFGLLFGAQPPIVRAEQELELGSLSPPSPKPLPAPDEWMRRLGTLPLMYQPGEAWLYNTPTFVLGVLLARVSGQSLPELLAERIFAPLGMKDTAFHVPASRQARLPAAYTVDDQGGLRRADAAGGASYFCRPPSFPSAGSGLVSTVDDFYAFARLLHDGGRTPDGRRLVSRTTLAAMTSDQTTPRERAASPWMHRGWGFGMGVWRERDAGNATPGRYGWEGGWGTSWSNDPSEDLVAILMTQRSQFPDVSPVHLDFWSALYAAIDD